MSGKSIKEQLVELAARRGCLDPLNINAWLAAENDRVEVTPGRFVKIPYRRADGGPRLPAQLDENTRTRKPG
jgi:hypothetical protein